MTEGTPDQRWVTDGVDPQAGRETIEGTGEYLDIPDILNTIFVFILEKNTRGLRD